MNKSQSIQLFMIKNLLLTMLVFVAVLFSVIPAVNAQSIMNARSGEHDGYSRVVFEWDKVPAYDVSKQGAKLVITFQNTSNAALNADSINGAGLKSIGGASISGNALTLSIPDDSKFRHFNIGKRIIVDVYHGVGAVNRAQSSPKATQTTPTKTKQQIQEMARKGQQVIVDQTKSFPAPRVDRQALRQAEQAVNDEAHVITLSATNKIGMAAFRRAGFLWLVVDDPSLAIAPKLSGPNKDNFKPFERMELPNGIAYRMPLEDVYYVYGEGGGLLWRVILTPNIRKTTPIKPETTLDGTSDLAGGAQFWPITGANKKITLKDPLLGDMIHAVTVADAAQYVGERRDYVDMQILNSAVGLAVTSWVDELVVGVKPSGVTLSKNGGLSLSSARDTAAVQLKDEIDGIDNVNEFGEAPPLKDGLSRIYNFKAWEMGGPQALTNNRRILMTSMGDKQGYDKVEDLLTLAKLNIANNRGLEALGLLRVAEAELAGIDESPEFLALKGAAATLASQYDVAIPSLFDKELERFGEINLWKAAALAGLEDWRQSGTIMPSNLDLVADYPDQVRFPIALKLAETSLRKGDVDEAEGLLALIDSESPYATRAIMAGLDYLGAEANRQRGDSESASAAWEKLKKGRDDYYRAKSGLSLTRLQLEEKKITTAEAINRLEALRYAWRGDELETLINYRLGQVYVESNDYLKGLSVLRNAVSLSPDSILSDEVTTYMTDTFRSLFLDGKLEEISTLDAVTIYDEFKELTPAGEAGDIFVQTLAENLVRVDLLGRAGALLEHQIIHRLNGEQSAKVGLRLAAIRLLDNKPDGALRALDLVDKAITDAAASNSKPYGEERAESQLLRARALSQLKRTGEAVDLLDQLAKRRGKDTNIARLKADMAWGAGRWDDAADALQDLIVAENISLTRPVNDAQRDLIMNRGIALNLASNRVGLANLRERFGDAMKQTDKARMFELVTRPRQMGLLGSRDSVESLMSEVDLFGDFLESYRKMDAAQ